MRWVGATHPMNVTRTERLRGELERYKRGMSAKARMVVANKADLLGRAGTATAEDGDGEGREGEIGHEGRDGEKDEEAQAEAIRAARAKLARLEAYVRAEMGVDDGRGASHARCVRNGQAHPCGGSVDRANRTVTDLEMSPA